MSERGIAAVESRSGLDRLADAAARRPIGEGRDPDALVREALIVGRARVRSAARRRATFASVSALAATMVLAFVGARWSAITDAPSAGVPAPSELALAGHRIATTPGTRFEARDASPQRVSIGLDAGDALFDVEPLGEAREFEVRTPDATVVVRGTVFAVSVRDARTTVRVFEGRVEVRDARGVRVLGAQESFSTGEVIATPPELAVMGDRAAAARAARGAEDPALRADDRVPEVEPSLPDAGEQAARARSTPDPEPRVAPTTASSETRPAASERAAPEPASVDLASLRAMCERGEFAEALAAMQAADAPHAERGEWAMVAGDAHRALGHTVDAAGAYARAASALTPTRAALAGYLAATQYERADDPERALAILDRAHAAERGSPLEERALSMRAALLARVGRSDEARIAARAYLAAFPGGGAVGRMEALLAE